MCGSTGLGEPPELLAGYVGNLLPMCIATLHDKVRNSAPQRLGTWEHGP